MIPHPPGWTVHIASGGELLVPPDGIGAGAIRYLERLARVKPATTLLAEQLAASAAAAAAASADTALPSGGLERGSTR